MAQRVDAVRWVYEQLAGEPAPFPYLGRVTGLPPLVAQAAFDAVRVTRSRRGQPANWDVEVTDGCLQLHGDGRVPPPPRPCYWSYREVPGRIRSTWWHVAVPVRLELVPWSKTRTALGLSVRGPYHLASEAVYQQVGRAALDVLAAELDAWSLHELHELERRLAAV